MNRLGSRKKLSLGHLILVVCLLAIAAAVFLVVQNLITPAQIELLDEYPLYVMHYPGDYGFKEWLEAGAQAGVWPSDVSGQRLDWSCTTFAALKPGSDQTFGRNFDWHNRPTLVLFTEPSDGYAAVTVSDASYLGLDEEVELTESERQGLLDAPYLPFDGMNEKGLAVGMMAVPTAKSPMDPNKTTISSLAAIRLILDYAANVDEAVRLLDDYNIDFTGGPPLHYLVADAAGHSVIIEYYQGEMLVTPNSVPWQVSTNFLFAETTPEGALSQCSRYRTVMDALSQTGGSLPFNDVMDLLSHVSQSSTVWSVAYDLSTGEMDLALGRNYENIYHFRLNSE